MTIDAYEGTKFLEIIEKLEGLAEILRDSDQTQDFRRLTMNHRILGRIQTNIYTRKNSSQDVSGEEWLMLKRGSVFNWSSLQSKIDFFRWSRLSTVQELAEEALRCAKANSLLVPLMILRSILEVTGNAMLLTKDLQHLADPQDESIERMEYLTSIESLVDGRLSGLRVDYSNLTKSGLRGAGKFAYKPGEFESDLTAKDLLKGIDLLDKRVKGARATYEFFSEFAHPNLASVWTNYDRSELLIKIIDIHGYVVHHKRRTIGEAFLDNFGPVVYEGIAIVADCVNEFLGMDAILCMKGEEVARQAKKAIREVVRRDPSSFYAHEDCPCNSGKKIQQCCGKLIKVSRFGK